LHFPKELTLEEAMDLNLCYRHVWAMSIIRGSEMLWLVQLPHHVEFVISS